MRHAVIVFLAIIALGGCAPQPIFDVDNHPMPSTVQKLSLERIEDLIIEAGQPREWQFERIKPGHLVASQVAPKYAATVDIFFDQKAYRISYKSSRGLEATGDTIHRRYNSWLRNLNRDIEARLSRVVTAAP